ncbi:MAG: GPR endopeptidase [Clostridia bacterium]
MENKGKARTDLASEAHRLLRNGKRDLGPLPGLEAGEETKNGFSLFRVRVLDERGAQALGKPVGAYCTLEAERLVPRGDERFPALAQTLAGEIRTMLGGTAGTTLVVGLGNREVTPDALGPEAARYVFPTRHLKTARHPLFEPFAEVAVCTPGVLAASGVESARQIAALCREIKPARVVALDALAGADPDRLCRCVQLADSGVAPGSGVGNDRAALSRESLGLPVLAIGVPTVVDAACFGEEALRGWFVTPKDIDESLRCAARLLGYALDLALHPGLRVEDISALLE